MFATGEMGRFAPGMTSGVPDSIHQLGAAANRFSQWIRNIAFVFWLAVASLLFCRLIIGYRQVRRWVADSVQVDQATQSIMDECCQELGLRTLLKVRVSSSVWTLLVTGLLEPVILIPPTVLRSLSPRELRAVLIHEVQHVIRADFAQECVLVLVQIVYFFHPCVWLANRQLRRLREQACDEATIAILNGQRREYGSGFVKVAELLTKSTPNLTLGIVDSDETATTRLRRILDPKLRIGRGVSWSSLMLIVVLGLVLIPSSARRTAIADSTQESNSKDDPEAKRQLVPLIASAPDDAAPNRKDVSKVTKAGDGNHIPTGNNASVLDSQLTSAIKKLELIGGTLIRNVELRTQPVTTIDLSKANQFTDDDIQLLKPFRDLTSLDLSETEITDSSFIGEGAFARLIEAGTFQNLTILRLARVPISDVGVLKLAKLTKLTTLDLFLTHVSDAGLAGLNRRHGLRNVETLILGRNAITDAGLRELAELRNLKTLDLYRTQVTGTGFKSLIGLKNLQNLNLSENNVSDIGLKDIGNLSSLTSLSLFATLISDNGTNDLKKLKNLTTLNIGRNLISDVGLRQLEKLRNLKEIDLTDDQVTTSGVRRFRQALKDSLGGL